MRGPSSLLCLFFLLNISFAQEVLEWQQLEDVSFKAIDESGLRSGLDMGDVEQATFGKDLKAWDGKLVQITGYMLPLTIDNQKFILSRYPFYQCYFCGGAGKETVIELKLTEDDWEFELDDKVSLKGRLKLNEDPNGLAFFLVDAEPLSP